MFDSVQWSEIFLPDTPLLEIFLRGTAMYLFLFCILRFVLKRQAGSLGISDLLVLVLIADASQNAMAGAYSSVPDGMVLVATLVFWNVALEWVGFHFPLAAKLLDPPPLPLVRHGRMIPRSMRRELITRDELLSQIREQGIGDITEVKLACLESDGHISVIAYDPKKKRKSAHPAKKKRAN